MATKKRSTTRASATSTAPSVSSSIDELLSAAQERSDESFETGRYLISYREGAADTGVKSLKAHGMRVADARDFGDQAVAMEAAEGADALLFPEIGVALVGGGALEAHGMSAMGEVTADDDPIEIIEPEHFVFAESSEYLRGFARAAAVIAEDLGAGKAPVTEEEGEETAVLGYTWGLGACRVPPSLRSGAGIKVAVLDTGMDLRHPDFAGRVIVSKSFVGQPVQDLHGHGTHCIGTACGPKSPPGNTPRYGIAYGSQIYVGKVLSNSGSSVGGSVLAGMNWAIANKCQVISMSLGAQTGPQNYYTQAGQAALSRGLLIVAAAGNSHGQPTMAPANSPTIMAVASLDRNLAPSNFSNKGKIEIAAPGRDIFSSLPMPRRYGTMSGTSMATPHVAGCAALWAQTSSSLRGLPLWRKLQATAKKLPYPATRVGAGLVQAP